MPLTLTWHEIALRLALSIVETPLRGLHELGDDAHHHVYALYGKLPYSGFRCEDKSVGAIVECVVNVIDFRQRGHCGMDHRFQ